MSDSLPWLTDAEVQDLTGYRRPTCQAKWLTQNGIRCFVNALGHVRVSRAAIDEVRSGKPRKRTEPDFSKVKAAG